VLRVAGAVQEAKFQGAIFDGLKVKVVGVGVGVGVELAFHLAQKVTLPVTGVLAVICTPPVCAVNHPAKVCPALVGLGVSAPTGWPDCTFLVPGPPVPPLLLNVTVKVGAGVGVGVGTGVVVPPVGIFNPIALLCPKPVVVRANALK